VLDIEARFALFANALRTALVGKGNPYIVTIEELATTNIPTLVSVNASLGRNAHYGYVKAHSANPGPVRIAFSHDGQSWSGYLDELLPGESISVDAMDIHSLRLLVGTIGQAGNDVLIGVW
jgi:hypothetical protein